MQQAGLTGLKGAQPDLKTPVAKKVEFGFSGKDEQGKPAFARGAIVFGKNVYQFQVLAGSEEDAAAMAKVAAANPDVVVVAPKWAARSCADFGSNPPHPNAEAARAWARMSAEHYGLGR